MGLRVWAPETAFPGLLVISGLLFAAVLPPCQAPDENKHFLRAYHVSEGHLVPEVTEPGWLGGNLPESVTRISETSKYLRFHSNVKVNPDVLRSLASDRLEPERRRPTSFEGAEANLFVGYIPQAMAIALGRLVGLNPIGLFYVARLANLTLAAFALSLALRLAPTGRLVFSMVALLPVTVQQVASVSPDASIISGAFLLTTLLLRASLVGVPAGWSLVARVAGLTAWLAVCKFTLAPLTLLCLGVPRKVLGSWFHYLAGAAVIGPAVLLAASLLIVGRAQAPPGPREDLLGRIPAPAEQAHILRRDPLTFLVAMGNSWVQEPYLDHLFTLGWLDTGIPRPLAYPYAAILIFVALASRSHGLPRRVRVVAIVAVVACLLAIFLAFFLLVTPPGDKVIRDVQGRYFIPFLPLALLLLSNRSRLTHIDSGLLLRLATAAGAAESVLALGTMVGRYYCPQPWTLWLVAGFVVLAALVGSAVWLAGRGRAMPAGQELFA